LLEAIWFKLCGHVCSFQSGVEVCFGFCWWNISDRFQQAAIVEPVDPFEGGVFDRYKAPPWATTMNDFRFEETVDCLSQCIVIGIPDAADGRCDFGFRQPLGVFDR
jgi:hypothetical protein